MDYPIYLNHILIIAQSTLIARKLDVPLEKISAVISDIARSEEIKILKEAKSHMHEIEKIISRNCEDPREYEKVAFQLYEYYEQFVLPLYEAHLAYFPLNGKLVNVCGHSITKTFVTRVTDVIDSDDNSKEIFDSLNIEIPYDQFREKLLTGELSKLLI